MFEIWWRTKQAAFVSFAMDEKERQGEQNMQERRITETAGQSKKAMSQNQLGQVRSMRQKTASVILSVMAAARQYVI